jgi:hypothetical protein
VQYLPIASDGVRITASDVVQHSSSADWTGPGGAGEVQLALGFTAGHCGVDHDLQVGVTVVQDAAVHGDLADVGMPDGLAVLGMAAGRTLVPRPREARVAVDGGADQPGQPCVVGAVSRSARARALTICADGVAAYEFLVRKSMVLALNSATFS